MLSSFAFLGLSPLLGFFVAIVLLATFIFEVVMFISVISNKFITDSARIFWILGMLLLHPFVAIAYYFTDYSQAA